MKKPEPRTVREMQAQAEAMVGKGSHDTRCGSYENRRNGLASVFGERCNRCGNNSKIKTEFESWYYCETCDDYFKPI